MYTLFVYMHALALQAQVEGKICTARDQAYGSMAWKKPVYEALKKTPFLRYNYDRELGTTCEVCGRSGHPASSVTLLIGPEYDSSSVWNSRRWDQSLPKGWRDPQVRRNFCAQGCESLMIGAYTA
jgi:Domain of unknown function (DUF4211)